MLQLFQAVETRSGSESEGVCHGDDVMKIAKRIFANDETQDVVLRTTICEADGTVVFNTDQPAESVVILIAKG